MSLPLVFLFSEVCLIQVKHSHLRALLSCHVLVQKESHSYIRLSVGKALLRLYVLQDFKIIFSISKEVQLMEAVFKSDFLILKCPVFAGCV